VGTGNEQFPGQEPFILLDHRKCFGTYLVPLCDSCGQEDEEEE
jgi:hypothetical protein